MMLQSLLNPPLAGELGRELTLCLQGMRYSPCTHSGAQSGTALLLSCAGRHCADTSSKRWEETVLNSCLCQSSVNTDSTATISGFGPVLDKYRDLLTPGGICPNSLTLRMYRTAKCCCNRSQKHQQAKGRKAKRSNWVLKSLEIKGPLDPCYQHKPQNDVIPENNHNSKRRGVFT